MLIIGRGGRGQASDVNDMILSENINAEQFDDSAQEAAKVPRLEVPSTFAEAVKSRVDSRGLIITPAVIDDGYLDNARNLYLTSIQRLNLTANTLFICISKAACAEARDIHNLPAVLYREAKQEQSGFFNTGAFIQKAMMKHYLIYDILKMGYDVLLTDLDLFWFKDPVDELRSSCIKNGRDFVIQSEAGNALNIGFMYVRPTKASLAFYKYVCEKARSKGIGGAQAMFNKIVKSNEWKNRIKYGVLSLAKFPDGYSYFEKQKRTIPLQNPCTECFICHNNWIVGTVAKTYRFREHLMWYVDDGKYYSDTCRKYIVYENPLGKTPEFTKDEHSALKSALAIALLTNRTLILPRTFHTKKASTQLNGVMLIQKFDTEFRGRYRESTFLHHHLVPKKTKDSECGKYLIMNAYNKAAKTAHSKQFADKNFKNVFVPKDEKAGATQTEIEEWLMTEEMRKCGVIRFYDLYYSFKGFDDKEESDAFNRKIAHGLVKGSYRQLDLMKS